MLKQPETIVKVMVDGNIRLSEDGFLLGEMSKEVFEKHYKPNLKGKVIYAFESKKKATRLTA